MREALKRALESAQDTQDQCGMHTIRLVMAAVRDRDTCAQAAGQANGIDDVEILSLLQTMVKHRHESIGLHENGDAPDKVERKRREIDVIRGCMPEPVEGEALAAAVTEAIRTVGARNMTDMGRTMAFLKQQYAGRMDFSRASGIVRQALSG